MSNSTDDIWARNEIDSPCVKLCQIHPQTRLCIGCKRSIDEITQWSRYSAEQRRSIMNELNARSASPSGRRGGRAARLAG